MTISETGARLPAAPHCSPAETILAALATGPHGLSVDEAAARLVTFGPNTLPQQAAPSILLIFARQFQSPLIYVLVLAGLVALALRYFADAGMIGAVLLINAVIGTLQEYGAQRSAEALGKLVPTRAYVLRGGEQHEVDTENIVPGEVVLLEAGTKVPADLRLLEATGIEADESLLTGESATVTKDAHRLAAPDAPLGDRNNMAFAGTMVVRGKAHGIAVATGARTQLGALAEALNRAEGVKPPLLQRMDRFARRVAAGVAVAVALIAVVAALRGMPPAQVFLICVALAVSAIPEGLPVALTVALALATRRMSRRNVIVRRLVAVEALGSCTFIASDKTGTLTMNELTANRVVLPGEAAWEVTGSGNVPEGTLVPPDDIALEPAVQRLTPLAVTAALCNEGFLGRRNDAWVSHGDAVDVALLALAHKVGVVRGEAEAQSPEVTAIPFEAENRFAASARVSGEATTAHVKGAVEALLPMCDRMATRDGNVALDADAIIAQATALARDGYRVLAFAAGPVALVANETFGPAHLRGLVFLGLVGMIDPLRPEAKAAVAACHGAGVEVAMVTGDHPATALSIAAQLGLATHSTEVVTGAQIAAAFSAGSERLDALVSPARVFARVEPQQKLLVVQSLTRLGHFVAVTGDGANDAPALRAAHVGVAMARRGTDVAREAASLIVTDDNFASIVAGIEEGRVAYANVRKVVFLLVATGATEVVLFLLSVGLGLPTPLLPVQLLWLNLVTNGIQDVALAFEPAEGGELQRPPRPPREAIFNRLMLERVAITAVIMGTAGFFVFRWMLASGWPIESARNGILLMLVLFENMQVGASRSETRPMLTLNPFSNPLLLGGTIAATLIHLGAMHTQTMGNLLRVEVAPLSTWAMLLPVALLAPLALEIHKVIRRPARSMKGAAMEHVGQK